MSAAACAFHYGQPQSTCPSCSATQPVVLKFCKTCGIPSTADGHFKHCVRQHNPEWVEREALSGSFTLDDVKDGVPGAAEAFAEQAKSEPRRYHDTGNDVRHDPRKPTAPDPTLTTKEWDEALDTPSDPKARLAVVDRLLDPLLDVIPSKSGQEVRDALTAAYDAGMADCARLIEVQPPNTDPMTGAIDRLREVVGDDLFNTREFGLALNEAFRNGMQSEQTARDHDLLHAPAHVLVDINGLRQEQTTSGYWVARPIQISNDDGTEFTIYRIEGDPNSVAVGRFKASLRKFLGV